MKWLYEMMYRYSFVPIPYDIGPREELVRLVEGGCLDPCCGIDPDSGTANNAIYLPQHGLLSWLHGPREGHPAARRTVED